MKTVLPGEQSSFATEAPGTQSLILPAHPEIKALIPNRQLKIHSKFIPRWFQQGVDLPEIRLCGKWLVSMGFACGAWVTVQPEPGRLVITLNTPAEGF